MKLHRMNGFSLIELMIVVVIVGILAAIAVPSYGSYVVKASREAAQAELMELASLQEKIYLNANNYTPNITGGYNGQTAANSSAAAGGLGRTSGRTSDGKYDLSLDIAAPAQTFTLTATPVAGKKQENDGCLTISESGRRTWHQGNDDCDSVSPIAW
ncbi:MAG: type IV pilin protein [Pseudomonadota bacterium]